MAIRASMDMYGKRCKSERNQENKGEVQYLQERMREPQVCANLDGGNPVQEYRVPCYGATKFPDMVVIKSNVAMELYSSQ
jgi:hypothetical protein